MKMLLFELLPNEEQADILYDQGVYLGKQKSGSYTILLYQLEGFYVEVFYRYYRKYISKINCSESTEILDPYLDQIQVEVFME